jgi:hypothetical protein
MAGSCECGNEPSGSIKCRKFLDWVRICLLLRKDSAPWSFLVTTAQQLLNECRHYKE